MPPGLQPTRRQLWFFSPWTSIAAASPSDLRPRRRKASAPAAVVCLSITKFSQWYPRLRRLSSGTGGRQERGAIEQRLPLRQRVEERRRVAADALRVCPTPERPSQPLALPPARHPSIAPWVVSGAGGLAFASGALLAQARHDLAQADPDVV